MRYYEALEEVRRLHREGFRARKTVGPIQIAPTALPEVDDLAKRKHEEYQRNKETKKRRRKERLQPQDIDERHWMDSGFTLEDFKQD